MIELLLAFLFLPKKSMNNAGELLWDLSFHWGAVVLSLFCLFLWGISKLYQDSFL